MARRPKAEADASASKRTRKPRSRPADTSYGDTPEAAHDEYGEAGDEAPHGEAGEGSPEDAAEVSATDAATPAAPRSVINRERYSYVVHKDAKTPSGRAAVDNNDAVAEALRGMTTDEVIETLVRSGGTPAIKWYALNPGMQRMSAGNVIRRMYNQGQTIHLVTGGQVQHPDHAAITAKANAPRDPKPEPDARRHKREAREAAQAARAAAKEDKARARSEKLAAREEKAREKAERAAAREADAAHE